MSRDYNQCCCWTLKRFSFFFNYFTIIDIAIEAAKRHGCSEEHVQDMEEEIARQKCCDSDHSPDYRTYQTVK